MRIGANFWCYSSQYHVRYVHGVGREEVAPAVRGHINQ